MSRSQKSGKAVSTKSCTSAIIQAVPFFHTFFTQGFTRCHGRGANQCVFSEDSPPFCRLLGKKRNGIGPDTFLPRTSGVGKPGAVGLPDRLCHPTPLLQAIVPGLTSRMEAVKLGCRSLRFCKSSLTVRCYG